MRGLPLQNQHSNAEQAQLQEVYERGLPAANLASLRLATPDPPLSTRVDALQRLLLRPPSHAVARRRLRVLGYEDRGQGTRFDFSSLRLTPSPSRDSEGDRGGGGDSCGGDPDLLRLPPLEELALRSYDWDHDARETAARWDFSRLRTLRLVDVPAVPFLEAVPPAELAGLRVLQCDGDSVSLPSSSSASSSSPATPSSPSGGFYSSNGTMTTVARATHLLADLVRSIRALDELALTCHVRGLGPLIVTGDDDGNYSHGSSSGGSPLLLHHARTLRTLRLRNLRTGGPDACFSSPPSSLRAAEVAGLARTLTGLRELELDFDFDFDFDPPSDGAEGGDDGTTMTMTTGSSGGSGEKAAFLRALCAFPRLRELTLHVPTAVRPSEYYPGLSGDDAGGGGGGGRGGQWGFEEGRAMSRGEQRGQWLGRRDLDYEAARRTFAALVRGRQQTAEKYAVPVARWQCVTLVVGGWRPVIGVRRTGAAWRALNRSGVFAERCFVLERAHPDAAADADGGAMIVREEMARTAE